MLIYLSAAKHKLNFKALRMGLRMGPWSLKTKQQGQPMRRLERVSKKK